MTRPFCQLDPTHDLSRAMLVAITSIATIPIITPVYSLIPKYWVKHHLRK
jgi:hypothetical protein